MQRTSATLRLSTQALILAFAALLLVTIGCTGAQASPIQASSTPAQAPASASISTLAAPWLTGQSPTVAAAPVADSPTAGDSTALNRDSLIEVSLNRVSLKKAVPNQAVLVQTAATSPQPACTPGRDTARMEKNAVSAPTALLQHSPTGTFSRNAAQAGWDADESLLSGRIPDALTHLDLGIVRT